MAKSLNFKFIFLLVSGLLSSGLTNADVVYSGQNAEFELKQQSDRVRDLAAHLEAKQKREVPVAEAEAIKRERERRMQVEESARLDFIKTRHPYDMYEVDARERKLEFELAEERERADKDRQEFIRKRSEFVQRMKTAPQIDEAKEFDVRSVAR